MNKCVLQSLLQCGPLLSNNFFFFALLFLTIKNISLYILCISNITHCLVLRVGKSRKYRLDIRKNKMNKRHRKKR